MEKLSKVDFLKIHAQEIEDLVEYTIMYRADGYNRLRIWKEFRENGTAGDLILEAFRRVGLVI